jgi:hypothetical protein
MKSNPFIIMESKDKNKKAKKKTWLIKIIEKIRRK